MKKALLLFFLSFLAFEIAFAAPRSFKQARAIATKQAATFGISKPQLSSPNFAPALEQEVDGQPITSSTTEATKAL